MPYSTVGMHSRAIWSTLKGGKLSFFPRTFFLYLDQLRRSTHSRGRPGTYTFHLSLSMNLICYFVEKGFALIKGYGYYVRCWKVFWHKQRRKNCYESKEITSIDWFIRLQLAYKVHVIMMALCLLILLILLFWLLPSFSPGIYIVPRLTPSQY